MQVLKPRVGYTELCQWPEHGRHYELYDGEVYVIPALRLIHPVTLAGRPRVSGQRRDVP